LIKGKIALLVLILLFVAGGTASARRTVTSNVRVQAPSCFGATSWQSANRNVGRYLTVKGRVAGTVYAASSNGAPTFLNLGRDYPDMHRFTVVIWGRNRSRFGTPESRYSGKTICVRGLISTYAGVPQIEATSPSQISVLR
jgi:hypothetical protein